MFSFFLSLKYLRPTRSFTSVVTVISVLGVMLGVAIIIIVRAVMTGFGDMWEEKILSFKPHITVSSWNGVIEDEEAVCRKLEVLKGIVAVSPGIEMRVLAEHKKRISAPLITGTDPERIRKMMPVSRMASGEFDLKGDHVVLGVDLAAELSLRVGDDILIYSPMNLVKKDEIYFPEKLKVAGIYDSGQRDFDSGFIFMSLTVARDLMSLKRGAYSIHAKVAKPQDHRVFSELVRQVQDTLGPMYRVRTWQEIDQALFNALAVEKNMMVILLMFITVVAIFCVTNTLIVITVQKTHEIGLLKALGFSSRQIMATFVLHGWIQCFAGTLIGIGLAYLVLHNLQALVDFLSRLGIQVFPKAVYGLSEIPWRVVPREVVEVAVSVILFCSAASFLPAWRAARMDPVEALRRE